MDTPHFLHPFVHRWALWVVSIFVLYSGTGFETGDLSMFKYRLEDPGGLSISTSRIT